jgi:cyanobactin maturation PatA/PatG family protease
VLSAVSPSGECACGGAGGGSDSKQIVYALGSLSYDFGTQAHRDSFAQAMPSEANQPEIAAQLLDYLNSAPFEAQSVIWTLNLDATPIYALAPVGAYANHVFDRLREYLRDQVEGRAELVSIPGHLAGSVRLMSGQNVPLLVPSVRGMYCWSVSALVAKALGERPTDSAKTGDYDRRAAGLRNYLNRIYYGLRNLGVAATDRALNFSATNAFQAAQVISGLTGGDTELSTINVTKSPVCRPDSDCYDVQLRFFNPANTNIADRIYRFTVDVSDVIPVSIGEVRSWSER